MAVTDNYEIFTKPAAKPRDILEDENPHWERVPYHTIRFGDSFANMYQYLMFKAEGIVNENETKATASVTDIINNAMQNKISTGKLMELFGLEKDGTAPKMLGKPFHQDTRVGGNDAINCLWQFNRDDDIMHPITTINPDYCIGEGRVYSSTTQTNQQICWFTFGVPYYSSLFATFKGAFNENLAKLNNQGYINEEGEQYNLAELFGKYATLTVCIWALPLKLGVEFARNRTNVYKVNRFYELRARMQLYYKYVDSMLAHWLVSSGIYNNGTNAKDGKNMYNGEVSFKNKSIDANPQYVPEALKLTGASIWDILRRRACNAGLESFGSVYDQDSDNGSRPYSDAIRRTLVGNEAIPIKYRAQEAARLDKNSYDTAKDKTASGAGEDFFKMLEAKNRELTPPNQAGSPYDDDNGSWMQAFANSALGATQFIGFRIDKSTDASESFSNSTQPSAIAEQYNAKVKEMSAKSIDYGLKGAQDGGSIFDKIVDTGVNFVKGVMEALQTVDFIGVTDLANAAMTGNYFDAPEQYAGSDFNKSHSLSFQLRSPYGDKISIYQSIMVPLFCILAGALPRSGGANAYTQPFLCRVYCRGMFAVPLGIIESVSIKRGDSEFGWTYDNLPTCIDVSISIKDMSPIMYITMYDSIFEDIMGTDSAFNEYLLTLSAVGLFERISQIHKMIRGVQYAAHKLRNRYFNPAFWSHSISQFSTVQFIGSFIPKTAISNR